jgi:hypothetical protein
MGEPTRAKSSLSLRIQVANVGLLRTSLLLMPQSLIESNLLLQQVFGEGRELKIAELLKNRSLQGTMSNYVISDSE